jgi:hypothetical protein
VPLERGRARGILAGLLIFGLGFFVSGIVAWTNHSGSPAYLTAVGIGFFGIGCVAFFLNRGTVPLPEGKPIWSRTGLAALSEALDLPALPVTVVVYALIGIGILLNVVLPFAIKR